MSRKIVIIGGGPGGYVAAIRASQLGNEATLIEKDEVGGTCLNRGCIPTKALIKSANTFWEAKKGGTLGIRIKEVSLDFQAVMKRKERVVKQLVGGTQFLLKKNNVKIIKGIATISDPKTVRILDSNEEVKTDYIVIATGSVPLSIKGEGIEDGSFITSNEILEIHEIPSKMAIVGGGVIGVEFAQIMSRMGVSVTVIEMMPNILPTEDTELGRILESLLKEEGIEIFTNSTVKKINAIKGGKKRIIFDSKEVSREEVVDKVLVAVGRTPETSNLGLERLGIQLNEKGCISVNAKMETNIPGIYAVGDVAGKMMLAHVASAEGKCAVENIAGMNKEMDYLRAPRCIYTSPEMACVGLTEGQARQVYGGDIMVGRFPLVGNSMNLILNEKAGLVKVIGEKKGREILGIEILSPYATELIGEGGLGMCLEASFEYFADTIHAHPSVSEAITEAVLSMEGKAIHV